MRDTIAELFTKEMITEEKRRATIETLQFGIYGAAQEFEFDLVEKLKPKISRSNTMVAEVRSLLDTNEDIKRLQDNRVENSREVVQRFPNSHRAWLNLAASHANGGQIKKAKDCAEKALEIAPNSISSKAMMGRILMLEGKTKDALLLYREILARGKSIAATESAAMLELVLGNVDQAIEELKSVLKEGKRERLSLYYNLGIAHLVKRKCGRAISYFRKAIQRDPDYYKAYGGIGVAYFILGHYKKAEAMFRIAVKNEPTNYRGRLNLSRTLTIQKKWDDAIVVLTSLAQDFPRYWPAREELGRLYISVNRPKEAAIQFNRLLEAINTGEYKGDISNTLNSLGVAVFFKGDFDKSAEIFKESIEVSEHKFIRASTNLIRVYLRTNKLKKAEQLLLELKERLGDDKIVLNLSTVYYCLIENYERAMEDAQKVLEVDKTDLDASLNIAHIVGDVYDDYSRAKEILRPLESKYSASGRWLNNMAYVLIQQGKIYEARLLLDKITKINGHDINRAVPIATEGLLYIRRGDVVEGSRLYNLAYKEASDKELKKLIMQKKELELGRWYKDSGQKEKARKHLERAVEYDVVDKIYKRKATEFLGNI